MTLRILDRLTFIAVGAALCALVYPDARKIAAVLVLMVVVSCVSFSHGLFGSDTDVSVLWWRQ